MIIPIDANPLNKDSWAVVVGYDPSGNVSDDEAGKINYESGGNRYSKIDAG
jgi:hypothetical protein